MTKVATLKTSVAAVSDVFVVRPSRVRPPRRTGRDSLLRRNVAHMLSEERREKRRASGKWPPDPGMFKFRGDLMKDDHSVDDCCLGFSELEREMEDLMDDGSEDELAGAKGQ